MTKKAKYSVLFIQEPDGGFSVIVPELPGCVSQGDTYEEAVKNINEAIELYLEDIDESETDLYQPYRTEYQFLTSV